MNGLQLFTIMHGFIMWNVIIRFQSYASNLYVLFLPPLFFGMNNIGAFKVVLLKSSHFQGGETQWPLRVKKSLRKFDN